MKEMKKGFPPIVNKQSAILILGSTPGEELYRHVFFNGSKAEREYNKFEEKLIEWSMIKRLTEHYVR
jgi:hypothetical protein